MNKPTSQDITLSHVDPLIANKVLCNTYILLSTTLLFSVSAAGISMNFSFPPPGLIITLICFFGLLYAVTKFQNSSLGLMFVFFLTGFMGFTIGPILNNYLSMTNGGEIVMTIMGTTAIIFLALSGYAFMSKKNLVL